MTTTGNSGLDVIARDMAKIVVEELRAEIQSRGLVDIAGAAEFLQISARSVHRLIQTRKLTAVKIAGTIRIERNDLVQLIANSKG